MRHQVRYMTSWDADEVLAVAREVYGGVRAGAFFGPMMEGREVFLAAARPDGAVVGFLAYEFTPTSIRLTRLGVRGADRLGGAGHALVACLADKLFSGEWQCLVADVPERRLDVQVFLRSVGFRAVSVLRGDDGGDDAFRMAYRLPSQKRRAA